MKVQGWRSPKNNSGSRPEAGEKAEALLSDRLAGHGRELLILANLRLQVGKMPVMQTSEGGREEHAR